MHLHRFLPLIALTLLGAFSPVRAEVSQEQMKALFSGDLTQAELEKAIADAAQSHVPPQMLAEAKLVWGLRHKDDAFLEKALPELEAVAKDFKKDDSAGLGSPEDFLALVNYIKALAALKKGDEDGFKKSITEAFWLSPDQGKLFAEAVTAHRTEQKMAKIKLDMKLTFTTSKGEATSLSAQLGKNKAVLLDFWASWCGPCMQLMPETKKLAAHLSPKGITVAGMNTESDEAVSEKVRAEKAMDIPWLVEPMDRPFSEPLGIESIPRMVLISPEGKILYNGHPQDPGLWAALKKVDASIEPPKDLEAPKDAEPPKQ